MLTSSGRAAAGLLSDSNPSLHTGPGVGVMVAAPVVGVSVGVGVNVNTPHENLPPDIRNTATSVLMETGKPFPRIVLLRAYLEWLEIYYETFMTKGFDPVMKRWKHLSDIIGRRIRVDLIDRVRIGEVMDADKDGFLILRDDEGTLERIISGDVTIF